MMSERELQEIEPFVWDVMSNKNFVRALTLIVNDEVQLAESEAITNVRIGHERHAQISVGKTDGVNGLMSRLQRVALGYERRKTSASR
jgi:hypothetical protein